MIKVLCFYLIAINLVGFLAMFLDKRRAIKNEWRIPETTLFLIALLGGSLGTTLGMNTFRHKTKHWYFKLGMPAILILQIVGSYFLLK